MANRPTASTVVEILTPDGTPLVGAAATRAAAPGTAFRIIRTTQVDPYDSPVTPAAARLSALTMAAAGETFQGTSRKAAKLSISTAKVEKFTDIKDLIETFPSHASMNKHKPKIKTDAKSNRVVEEQRNVLVDAFIWAASREDDNDFHLIVGRALGKPKLFLTMEISGLPPASAASRPKLEKARNAFKKIVKQLPGTGYDFYDPPIKVQIGGSLFWDASHATGSRPGPKDLRPNMPVVWEVHPITVLKVNT